MARYPLLLGWTWRVGLEKLVVLEVLIGTEGEIVILKAPTVAGLNSASKWRAGAGSLKPLGNQFA